MAPSRISEIGPRDCGEKIEPGSFVFTILGAAKVTGKAIYAYDVRFPDQGGLTTSIDRVTRKDENVYLDGIGLGETLFGDHMAANMIITADEAAQRKVSFTAGQNPILLNDETLTDLTDYMQGPYAGLQPYALARQAKSTDIIPLSAGSILGEELAPNQVWGVSVPVGDQYVLIPSESAVRASCCDC